MEGLLNFGNILGDNLLGQGLLEGIPLWDIIISLVVTFLAALLIFYVYRKTFKGILYSHSFSVSLIMAAVVTCLIIMTISTNLLLALGLIGALSIVRFRTAIKDPMDIIFIYWAIAVGIAAGAKFYLLVIIGTVFVGVIAVVFFKYQSKDLTFMLIIRYQDDELVHQAVGSELEQLKYSIKSRTISKGKVELTVELRLKGDDASFVDGFSAVKGVEEVILVSYSGEYASD